MKVLLGCEESGVVRDEFKKLGHDAWSCDLVPSRKPGKHIQKNILDILSDGWDMAIFFTPCTYLSNSGVKHLYINGKNKTVCICRDGNSCGAMLSYSRHV
jgi:hypothetical protein